MIALLYMSLTNQLPLNQKGHSGGKYRKLRAEGNATQNINTVNPADSHNAPPENISRNIQNKGNNKLMKL